MKKFSTALLISSFVLSSVPTFASEISTAVNKDYEKHLASLWDHFHRNPELSLMEFKTAKRLAKEIRSVGFDVTENIGGTGIVAILKNGDGSLDRVYVGPMIQRSKAEQTKASLREKMAIKGIRLLQFKPE